MMEINENMQKLIAELRSGKRKQTRAYLRVRDSFCCLGVACDISGLGKWELAGTNDGGQEYYRYVIRDEHGFIVDSDHTVLPVAVAQWLGIDTGGEFHANLNPQWEGSVLTDDEISRDRHIIGNSSLAELNDDGLTFEQIADILANPTPFNWFDPPV